MTISTISTPGILGLAFVLIFLALMLASAALGGKHAGRNLRSIAAFHHLGRAVGLAVEAGQRLHVSLGSGGLLGIPGASALVGLSVLQRIARVSAASDRPPIATAGEGALTILSQDTLSDMSALSEAGEPAPLPPGQLTGPTPFSYAAGTVPVLFDQQVSASILAGHFDAEAALIADAADRSGSLTLAGSDSLTGQAVFYATAQEPLIGEEIYAAGAYVNAGILHVASLRAQDILRWVVIVAILAGAVLKLAGVL